MDALKSLVQPLVGGTASSSVIDGMKLVVLGGTVETARRVSSSAWNHFVNSFFLTAHFSEEDLPYDWLMLWLSRRPEWQRSREFETTTRSANPGSTVYSPEDADWDAWEAVLGRESSSAYGYDDNSWGAGDDDEMRPKTRVVFQPTYDTTHTIFYRGHWLRVKRSRRQESGCEMLSISVVARNNAILKQLVLQAKKEYEAESVHRIQIYFADAHGSWRWTDSRHKRPMGSIVLNPGVKEMLLEDARDFLKSEKWYADRGIPFRRGYLLHGVPGSGKSSLIHALAGQLQLDIYVVSLSASWISDNTLTNLMGRVPARCVLLLEDLDAAFVRSTNREGEEDDSLLGALGGLDGDMKNALGSSGGRTGGGFNSGSGGGKSRRRFGRSDGLSDMNTLSLSGLLNALDGVAASEGRLLFATTNHLERLDPALSRPGRMDVWVEFKNASRWQAEALFRNFFPAYDEDDLPSTAEMDALHLDANMHVRTFVPNEDEIQLSSRSRTPSTSSSAPASPPSKPGLSLWNIASSAQSLLSSTPSSSTLNSRSSPPPEPSSHHPNMPPSFGASNTAYPAPPPSPSLKAHSVKPFLDKKTLSTLAKQFADAIPEEEFSVASLQGYLLKHKAQPYIAASGAAQWVESELHMRERLKKEKAEREVKLRQVRERKRKVREEKERVKKEKERKEKEKERVKKLIAEKEEEEELEKMKTQLKEKEEAAKKKKEEEAQAAKDAAKAAKKGKKKSKKAKGDADADAATTTTTTTTTTADATPATDAAEGDAKATTSETKVEDAPKAEDKPVEASVSSSVVVVEAVADEDEDDSESGSDGEGNEGGSDGSGSDSWDEEDESDGSEA